MKTEKFLDLCERGEWEIANAYVEELWDSGQDIKAERFRRLFLQAQSRVEEDVVFVPYEHDEPPALEAWWFEGSPQEYDQAEADKAENLEQTYRELTQTV